ncbi:hypothetical protein ACA910_000401 [Epithemia clementina (nom. ined.)]
MVGNHHHHHHHHVSSLIKSTYCSAGKTTAVVLLLLWFGSPSLAPTNTVAAAAASFPGRIPTSTTTSSTSSTTPSQPIVASATATSPDEKNNNNNNNNKWNEDNLGGGGGASSDDEADEEEESSDDEEWNRLSAALLGSTFASSSTLNATTTTTTTKPNQTSLIPTPTTESSSQQQEKQAQQEVQQEEVQQAESQAPLAVQQSTTATSNQPQLESQQQQEEHSFGSIQQQRSTAESETARREGSHSPPMQTLNKLQQMLEDTDYMTSNSDRRRRRHLSSSSSTPTTDSTTTTTTLPPKRKFKQSYEMDNEDSEVEDKHGPVERLWTSKDRAKYKRLQQQQQHRDKPPSPPPPAPLRRPQQVQPPRSTSSSSSHHHAGRSFPRLHNYLEEEEEDDDDTEEGEGDEDDLGYTLPNLPVYYSDAEESDDDSSTAKGKTFSTTNPANYRASPLSSGFATATTTASSTSGSPLPNPYYYHPGQPQQQQPPPPHSYAHGMPPTEYQTMPPPPPPPPPHSYGPHHPNAPHSMYGYPYPYPPYMTPQQHAYYSQYWSQHHHNTPFYNPQQYGIPQQQPPPPPPQPPQHQHPLAPPQPPFFFQARGSTTASVPPLVVGHGISKTLSQPPQQRQSLQNQSPVRAVSVPPHESRTIPSGAAAAAVELDVASLPHPPQGHLPRSSYAFEYTPVTIFVPPETIPDLAAVAASHGISFDSFLKIGLMLVTVSLACYSGVSPRTLPLSQYNLRFYENLGLLGMAVIGPTVQCLLVINPQENDLNAFIHTFFTAATLGYALAFGSEIISTTIVRLIVFTWFEPKIFSLAPKVPVPVIPWVLRETGYRPKRITLLAAEIAASCVVCPIIEEYIKLLVMRWTTNLKRNFVWTKTSPPQASSANKRGGSKWVAEPILRPPNEPDIVNANQYVSQMLAASLGLKLCDAGRRILLYTKPSNPSKGFYALCRGIFPIQELCGTMTALGLAKKHLLGVHMPLWKMLFPAVLIHAMANFRGKKPIYRWGSATPWSEMQLPAFHILDSSSLPQLLSQGFAKIMWLIIIFRVTGYCVKNYFMVNRQAVKRTTTYAGKPAAFSAELTATDLLKKK